MKKTLGILALLMLMFCSCRNNSTNANTAEADETDESLSAQQSMQDCIARAMLLDKLQERYDEPTQVFHVSGKEISKVVGKQGTVITVNPESLETLDGRPVNGEIKVELKEQTNQLQLAIGNTQTTSNGELLVSGGAYYIGMSAGGEELKIKDGKDIEVEFPKLAEEEMELFYGQRDELGQMNWEVVPQKFKSKKTTTVASNNANNKNTDIVIADEEFFDTQKQYPLVVFDSPEGKDTVMNISKEEYEKRLAEQRKAAEEAAKAVIAASPATTMTRELYDFIKINRLGWINCDRFYRIPNSEKTNLILALENAGSVKYARTFLIFKEMNSVMIGDFNPDNNIYSTFNDIPVGRSVRLVVYGVDENDKLCVYSSDFTIRKDIRIDMELQGTDKGLDHFFNIQNNLS